MQTRSKVPAIEDIKYQLRLAEKKIVRAKVRSVKNKLKRAVDRQARNIIDTLDWLIEESQ